ncbi:MAG: hypothetical protein KHW46_06720 [Clostridiales bacterium]|nr:hypothetical protein [Clostridiales bacterium]
MEFIGRGAGTRSERNWIFFITGAKRRFQKIDQREGERERANKEESDIFYNRSEVKVSKNRPKRSERKSANKEKSGIFYNRNKVKVSKNRPKRR